MLYRKPERRSISNHSDKYRCLVRIRQVHGEYSVEHSMERYVVGVVDFSFDYVQASDDAGLYKKGDRLIACSGAWPATSRLTVDFYFTYYMKRYEYALHIEKGSFWTEDSEGIPWSYAFPDELVIESVLPDHDASTIFEIREDQRPQ